MKKINSTVLIIFLSILFTETIYGKICTNSNDGEIASSSNVYVLSNRVVNFKDNATIALNKVKTNSSLDYIIANSFAKDSLTISKTDSTEFLSEISSLDGNWLVFVHGDAKTLEQSIWRALTIQKLHNINVLIFTWPSKNPKINGIKNFKSSQSNVGKSLNHFMQVLNFVKIFRKQNPTFLDEQKISLFFHSLGNLYMEKMIKNDLQKGLPIKLFDNIILNAAAVNQENHSDWVEKIKIQERIYITSNKHDFNLKGLRIFSKNGKQLGEKITPTLANNANYIHFDKSIGFNIKTGQTHTYFIGGMTAKSKNIKDFYSTIFHGKGPNLDNKNKFYLRKDLLGYELISNNKK